MHMEVEGRRVFDLGANAGSFNGLCYQKQCAEYVGFEPDEDNFDCLALNNKIPNSILHNAAAIRGDDQFVEFLEAESGGNKLLGEVKNEGSVGRGRISKKVKAVNFHKLVELHQPEVIKCDIEGSEFDLFDRKLPDSVCQVAMEIHVFGKKDRLDKLWWTIWGHVFKDDMWTCDLQPIWTPRKFQTFHGFNCLQMGFKRPWDWRDKHKKNRFVAADRMLMKHYGSLDRSNEEVSKFITNFFKNEPENYLKEYLSR